MQLPLCRTVKTLHSESAQILLLMAVSDYARYAGEDTEGLTLEEINPWFENEEELELISYELQSGSHELLVKGIFEYGCVNGMVDTNRYLLTGKAKGELLGECRPHLKKGNNIKIIDRDICRSTDIKEKTIYYNEKERKQLERLKTLLGMKELKEAQTRLSECGIRQGITCLFYGAFDRRFLFKIEFTKPGNEARQSIWCSMLPEISVEECMELARENDFSGGQIENIARKCKIEYVVSGKMPTLAQMKDFCKEEYLNRNDRARIGF